MYVSGYPQPQYRWLKDGVELGDFSTEHFYRILNTRREDGGSYQCVAKNEVGSILSKKIDVTVACKSRKDKINLLIWHDMLTYIRQYSCKKSIWNGFSIYCPWFYCIFWGKNFIQKVLSSNPVKMKHLWCWSNIVRKIGQPQLVANSGWEN